MHNSQCFCISKVFINTQIGVQFSLGEEIINSFCPQPLTHILRHLSTVNHPAWGPNLSGPLTGVVYGLHHTHDQCGPLPFPLHLYYLSWTKAFTNYLWAGPLSSHHLVSQLLCNLDPTQQHLKMMAWDAVNLPPPAYNHPKEEAGEEKKSKINWCIRPLCSFRHSFHSAAVELAFPFANLWIFEFFDWWIVEWQ